MSRIFSFKYECVKRWSICPGMPQQLNVTFGSCDTCFMDYFGHKIRWIRYFDRVRSFFEVVSKGQVMVSPRSGQGQVKKVKL